MNPKRLPTDKTLVVEVQTMLADRVTKSKGIHARVSARVGGSYRSGDFTLNSDNPLVLNDVLVGVTLSAFGPFALDLYTADGQLSEIQVSGLFVIMAPFKRIVVRSETELRISYNVA